mmetsp:Transcript_40514/g.104812  ORF Transcript_40514/g.104812 Transcript_40514/m.104812 type:complete len:269 (-) Transcript_40514:784-1590(-)
MRFLANKMSSLAAPLLAMRSLYSAFSAWRCSVAWATDLSSSVIPFSSAAISSVAVAMPSFVSSMTVWRSARVRSRAFFLSSDSSNWTPQYSFLVSSSTCSFFRVVTSSSIMVMTFSKPIFLPLSAKEIKSNWGLSTLLEALLMMFRAFAKTAWRFVFSWTKLALALGSVFLKSSSASSSLSTLMVSARATNSSERVFLISSHSAVLEPQLVSSSIANLVSALSEALVSSKSFFIPAISTPRSPTLVISASICSVTVATSFCLAAISSW